MNNIVSLLKLVKNFESFFRYLLVSVALFISFLCLTDHMILVIKNIVDKFVIALSIEFSSLLALFILSNFVFNTSIFFSTWSTQEDSLEITILNIIVSLFLSIFKLCFHFLYHHQIESFIFLNWTWFVVRLNYDWFWNFFFNNFFLIDLNYFWMSCNLIKIGHVWLNWF